MDQISEGQKHSMEVVWIKAAPPDASFYMKSEDEFVTVQPGPLTFPSNIEVEFEAVNIKSEISLGDYECLPSSTLNDVESIPVSESISLQLRNDEKFGRNQHTSFHCDKKPLINVVEQKSSSVEAEAKFTDRLNVHEHLFSCDVCGKTYNRKESLNRHKLCHSREKPFACYLCDRSFADNCHLQCHMRTHTKPFSCEECGKRFGRKQSLERHQRSHTGEKPFHCDECDLKFSSKYQLSSHKLRHTGERRFPCDQCDKKFTKKCHLMTHKIQHTGDRPFACEECGMRFSIKFYLKSHKLKHAGVKPFACSADECEKKFYTRNHLNQHKRVHARKTEPGTASSNCEIVFGDEENIHSSLQPTSNENLKSFIQTSDSECNCDESESHFGMELGPEMRQLTHIDIESIPCDEIGIKFDEKGQQSELTQSQSPKNPFPANEFGAQFVNALGMEMKERTDLGNENGKKCKQSKRPRFVDKPFACSECEAKFATETRFKLHQRVHTGGNRFICEECGTGFRRMDSLAKHKFSHTD